MCHLAERAFLTAEFLKKGKNMFSTFCIQNTTDFSKTNDLLLGPEIKHLTRQYTVIYAYMI
jgi:hypothetical protein